MGKVKGGSDAVRSAWYLFLPIAFLYFVAESGAAGAATRGPATPGPRDKCPVCGMFVAKFPDFAAQIRLKDGSTLFFDGAKDMFKHYLALQQKGKGQAEAIYVTEYYSLKPIDARSAWFVTGSDIHGPMGKEAVPFARKADAEEFTRDHKGKRILRLGEVSRSMIREID